MTDDHFAYCDGFPLDVTGNRTIDHFKPKTAFEEWAYIWENLYLACEKCQSVKRERYDECLLRPDEPAYEFIAFFVYQEKSGDLAPHPGAPSEIRARANVAIEIFGLNSGGRPVDRRRQLEHFRALPRKTREDRLQDWPYRFLMEPECAGGDPAPL